MKIINLLLLFVCCNAFAQNTYNPCQNVKKDTCFFTFTEPIYDSIQSRLVTPVFYIEPNIFKKLNSKGFRCNPNSNNQSKIKLIINIANNQTSLSVSYRVLHSGKYKRAIFKMLNNSKVYRYDYIENRLSNFNIYYIVEIEKY